MAILIDVECYKNFFLFYALNTKTRNTRIIPMYEGCPLDEDLLRATMQLETVSFNGLKYDLAIIFAALSGWDCARLHKLSNDIIQSKLPIYKVLQNYKLKLPYYNHIDLIEVAIGQASLKIYGGRLNAQKMQDLPIDPQSFISPEQREILTKYCYNDLELTELLYNKLLAQIELRRSMSEQYGMDLKSKSDAQIAEAVIKSELSAITEQMYKPRTFPPGYIFYYTNPKIIFFHTDQLTDVFNKLLKEPFQLSDSGSVQMPVWLAKQKIRIGTTDYQMGIGGLHSCEKGQYIESKGNYLLSDFDVSSFYPSIILQQELYPKSMGEEFLALYQSIVDRRIFAKKNKDDVEANTLKIVLNGSYGKFGSKYSALYSPELLLQTTLTGQLSLLMLIETLEANGIKVISANTDGIVTYYYEDKRELLEQLLFDWELDTSYNLEETVYQAIASRDVNNYIAIKTDGKVKGKGCFADPSLSKNPDGQIIYEAVITKVSKGIPLRKTITECTDITKFVTVRTVDGGAVIGDKYLGKAIRFYRSNSTELTDATINYAKNGNKVPNSQSCRPLMDLPDKFPSDVDYSYYYDKAKELLADIGYKNA